MFSLIHGFQHFTILWCERICETVMGEEATVCQLCLSGNEQISPRTCAPKMNFLIITWRLFDVWGSDQDTDVTHFENKHWSICYSELHLALITEHQQSVISAAISQFIDSADNISASLNEHRVIDRVVVDAVSVWGHGQLHSSHPWSATAGRNRTGIFGQILNEPTCFCSCCESHSGSVIKVYNQLGESSRAKDD